MLSGRLVEHLVSAIEIATSDSFPFFIASRAATVLLQYTCTEYITYRYLGTQNIFYRCEIGIARYIIMLKDLNFLFLWIFGTAAVSKLGKSNGTVWIHIGLKYLRVTLGNSKPLLVMLLCRGETYLRRH